MDPFYIWLESTSLSVWVRESTSVFAFPIILSLHTIGMGFVVGVSAAFNLRILGVAPGVPLLEIKRFFPVLWAAFWLNAASGMVLLIGYPTKAFTNPLFYVKLALIALALVGFRALRRAVFENASPERSKILAAASLACWASVITSGRFLAYTYSKLTTI